jgi:hypothetical protein
MLPKVLGTAPAGAAGGSDSGERPVRRGERDDDGAGHEADGDPNPCPVHLKTVSPRSRPRYTSDPAPIDGAPTLERCRRWW